MEKLRLTCPCGGVKQDIKCGATKAKPAGNQKEIACTDACRVRRLAMALDIDPEREGGTTPSYTDETVAIYNKNPGWAPAIESKFRSFVENKEQKRLQFRPMQVIQREFCHLLAVDLGLDSESQDPEPYRSVVIRKPANFTTAPRKTIAEFIGVKPPGSSGATAVLQLKKISRGQAVNAFVLKGIQVGMLASDLEKEIAPTLKESQLRFDIAWHGDEDVLLKPRASSLAVDQVETELHSLSTKLKRVIALKGLADSTELCWVGQDGRIANSGASGWSLANPRKSAPSSSWSTGPMLASRNVFDLFSGAGGSSAATITATQLATKREKERLEKERLKEKEKEKMKEVVDSWEMEADEDDEGAGSDRPAEGSNQGASNAPSMEDKPSNSSEPEVSSSTTEVEVRPADS